MIWLIFLSSTFAAEPKGDPPREKSAFEQALEQDAGVDTEERWIEVDGVRYREVNYQGKHFYMNFKNPGTAEVSCYLKSPGAAPRRSEVGVQVTRRTRAFVQLLKETCEKVEGGREILVLTLDPRIGFTLPEDEKSAIKNKRIYYNPLQGLGFSGEW